MFEGLCAHIEALSVDSASNEVVSFTDMSKPTDRLEETVLTPQCKHILRDSAHSARRILSRLWKSDTVLSDLFGMVCQWPNSIGQLIMHSGELQDLYLSCQRECENDAGVSTAFAHLRSAKHRIETHVAPLSRVVLSISAVILFAVKLQEIRTGEREGKAAGAFLKMVCPLSLLVLAMMADAAFESLGLIRHLDSENVSVADMATHIQQFLDRVAWLFCSDGVLHVSGHTSFILEWLRKPHFFLLNGEGKCVGGNYPDRSLLDSAFKYLRTWAHLAGKVLMAEFPSFALVSAFSVFQVPDKDIVGNTQWMEVRKKLNDKLDRLAKTFKRPELKNQFFYYLPYAIAAAKRSTRTLSDMEAWKAVQLMKNHDYHDLLHVLMRFVCYCPSTSGIEQWFSRIKHRLSDQKLVMSAGSETRAISLLVADHDNDSLDELCKRSQQVYKNVFGWQSRAHCNWRVDRGTKRERPDVEDDQENPTAASFYRRFRREVQSADTSGCAATLVDQPGHWLDTHKKESKFQDGKHCARLVEAMHYT